MVIENEAVVFGLGAYCLLASWGPFTDWRGPLLGPCARPSPGMGAWLSLRHATLGSSLACSAVGTLVPWVPAWLLLGCGAIAAYTLNSLLYPESKFSTERLTLDTGHWILVVHQHKKYAHTHGYTINVPIF